jgi:CheY-like chemotaxis protein
MASLNVLIAEDEPLIAMAMQLLVEDLGGTALGPYANVASAVAAARSGDRIDCALLDWNLGKEPSAPVADALAARGVAFAFTSGQGTKDIAQLYPGCTVFPKPVDESKIEHYLRGFVRD